MKLSTSLVIAATSSTVTSTKQEKNAWLKHFTSEWYNFLLFPYMTLSDIAKLDTCICTREYRDLWLTCLMMNAISSKLYYSVDFRDLEILEKVTEWCFIKNIEIDDLVSIQHSRKEIQDLKNIRLTFMRSTMKFLFKKKLRDEQIAKKNQIVFYNLSCLGYITGTILLYYLRCVMKINLPLTFYIYFVLVHFFTTFYILRNTDNMVLFGITLLVGPAGFVFLLKWMMMGLSLHHLEHELTLSNLNNLHSLIADRYAQGNVPRMIDYYYENQYRNYSNMTNISSVTYEL